MPLKYKLDDISFYGIKSKVKKILHFDLYPGEILQVCIYVIAGFEILKKPPLLVNQLDVRILVGQGYYDNSIMFNIFITTETQPKLTIPFFSRPEKAPTRDMRIFVHVLVPAGTMEKSTQ